MVLHVVKEKPEGHQYQKRKKKQQHNNGNRIFKFLTKYLTSWYTISNYYRKPQ